MLPMTLAALFGCIIPGGYVPVPANRVYVNTGGSGFQQVRDGLPEAKRDVLRELHEVTREWSVSTVVAAHGTDSSDALWASKHVLAVGQRNVEVTDGQSVWIFAYLGHRSSTPTKVVKRVERRGDVIRVIYAKLAWVRFVNADWVPYFAWADVGPLPPGTYRIELFDADEKAVETSRRFKVVDAKGRDRR